MKLSRQQLHDQFADEARSRGFKMIGKYIGVRKKIEMICPNNHVTYSSPNNFRKKHRNCKECSYLVSNKSREKFEAVVRNRGYKMLDEYFRVTSGVLNNFELGNLEIISNPASLSVGFDIPNAPANNALLYSLDFASAWTRITASYDNTYRR